MTYTCILASSAHWRVARHEGDRHVRIERFGTGARWITETIVTDADELVNALRRRSLGIPPEDVANIIAQLGPPLAFSPGTRPAWEFSASSASLGRV